MGRAFFDAAATPLTPQPPAKLPIPPAEVQQVLLAQVNATFPSGGQVGPREQIDWAKQLILTARQEVADPNQRFAYFRRAAEVGCSAGDVGTMLQAVDSMGRDFQIDVLDVQEKMLARVLAGGETSVAFDPALAAMWRLADRAVAEKRFELALAALQEAQDVCATPQYAALRKDLRVREGEMQKLAKQWQQVGGGHCRIEAEQQRSAGESRAGVLVLVQGGKTGASLALLGEGKRRNAEENGPAGAVAAGRCGGQGQVGRCLAERGPRATRGREECHAGPRCLLVSTGAGLRAGSDDEASRREAAGRNHPHRPSLGKERSGARGRQRAAPAFAARRFVSPRRVGGSVGIRRSAKRRCESRPMEVDGGRDFGGKASGGLPLRVALEGNYDMEVQFTRLRFTDAVVLVFVVNGRQCALALNAYKTKEDSFQVLEGQLDNSPRDIVTSVIPGEFSNNQRHTVLVRVRLIGDNASVEARFDGKPLLYWVGPQTGVKRRWGLPLRAQPACPGGRRAGDRPQRTDAVTHRKRRGGSRWRASAATPARPRQAGCRRAGRRR